MLVCVDNSSAANACPEKALLKVWQLGCGAQRYADRPYACAGLIATEAGTIGRFTGNALISIVGSFTGSSLKDFAHVLYILFIAMMAVLQCALFALWSKFLV